MRDVSQAMSAEAHGSTGPCGKYELAAEAALRGGESAPRPPDLATEVKYAEWMRAHGTPNYPDPNPADPGETNFNGTGMDPSSPDVQNANKLCDKQVGIPYVTPIRLTRETSWCRASMDPAAGCPTDRHHPAER